MKVLLSPVVLALAAHILSWAFAVWWLHYDRNIAPESSGARAQAALASPVAMSFVILWCSTIKRYWQLAMAMTCAAIVLAWLGSLTIGPYLWPAIAFMVWSTARMHEEQRSAAVTPAHPKHRVFLGLGLAAAALVYAMLSLGVLSVVSNILSDLF